MASAKVASMIPPGSGVFSMIQNMRWGDTGVLTVRSAHSHTPSDFDDLFDNPSFPGDPNHRLATARGFQSLSVGTNPAFTFASLKRTDDGTTAVYVSTDMSSWREITATSGKRGNTRFPNHQDYETTFQIVYDRYDKRYCLVVQNGTDFPRVCPDFGTPGFAAIHQPITPPTRSNNWAAELTWKSYFLVNDYHWVTYSASPTHYDVVNGNTGTVGSNTVQLQHAHAVPSGDITITFQKANNDLAIPDPDPAVTVKMDGRDCRQLAIVIRPYQGDFGVSHFLQNFTIAIPNPADALKPYVISDPTDVARQATVVPADLSSRTYVVACSLDEVPDSVLSAFNQIILKPIDGAVSPSGTYKLDILCVAATGNVPGNVSYAITYYNRDSRAESYEQVIATRCQAIDSLGSKYVERLKLPDSELLYFKTWIHFQNTTEEERDRGTDFVRVYRKQNSSDPNLSEQAFTYVTNAHIADYDDVGGQWIFTQSTDALQLRGTPDNRAPEERLLWLASPGAFQEPIPISRCMAQGGNRLLCGARISDGQDAFPRLSASGASMPFRFSSLGFDQDDVSAPFEQDVPGENLQGFAVAAGASLGTNVVYVFTDQAVWMLNLMAVGTPTLLSREMSVGTDSPFTIAERHGRIYFLDSDRQVRLIAGDNYVPQTAVDPQGMSGETPIPLSRGVVDELLRAIPEDRVRSARGLWFNNRYYLYYSRPSTSGDIGNTYNCQCLVFSEHANAWESRDTFSDALRAECPLSWRVPSSGYGSTKLPKMIVLSKNAMIYQLEVPSGVYDFGTTPVDVQLTTGDLHESLWSGLHVKGIGLLADDQNARTLQADVTYKPSGTSSSFSVSLDSTNPYQWAIERTQTAAANGIAASVDFTGQMRGEAKFYALKMEVEPREMLAPKAG
jgi:hypothetical protein